MWFMLTHVYAFQNGSDSILCPPCGHPQPVSGWHCPHTGRTPCQRLPLPSLQERPVPYWLQAKERSVHRYKMKLKVVMLLVLHQLCIYLSISGLCFAIYNLQNLFIVCLRHCLFVCFFTSLFVCSAELTKFGLCSKTETMKCITVSTGQKTSKYTCRYQLTCTSNQRCNNLKHL